MYEPNFGTVYLGFFFLFFVFGSIFHMKGLEFDTKFPTCGPQNPRERDVSILGLIKPNEMNGWTVAHRTKGNAIHRSFLKHTPNFFIFHFILM